MSDPARVLYDGDCRFCRASVDWLRRLDAFGRLSFEDARDPAILTRHPTIDPAAALARLHLVPPGGTPLAGFYAFRWIAGRLPALWIAWPFLWLPGAAWVGVRAYDRIARSRFAFGTCEDGACAVPKGEAQPVTSKPENV
jgi:predicted DCC family thiol-disulfide oxidoreductase YuxK